MFKKIIFLVSSLSQPRCIRRIESIKELGYDVIVYGYDRKQYNCNVLSKDIECHVLGELEKGGGYLSKILTIRRDIKKITSKHKNEKCLYYSFGYFESLFLRLNNVPYAYEISDIAYGTPKFDKIRPLMKAIDRNLVKNAKFTLLTSEGFKGFLNQKKGNYIIQPNKVNKKIYNVERKVLDLKNNHIVFSFVGSIRYESMMRFAEVIGKKFPHHEFHFYGVANVSSTQKKIDELTSKYSNVKLFGAFKSPDDFEKIYSTVDVVVTTYGNESLNERILDPNKLYEGILFCKPLIATQGTFLAKQVDKYKCGIVIDSSTEESICNAIEKIKIDDLNKYSLNESLIERNFAFDDMNKLKIVLQSLK